MTLLQHNLLINYIGRSFAKGLTILLKLKESVWFFPVVLTVLLICLTTFRISGSSIGAYYQIFNGGGDPSLLLNSPREIRSDEWVVNTQMTIAQANNEFKEINANIGSGTDMAMVIDAPYLGWSELFRPQNWSFFFMSFDYAFAFKWWFMAYALVLSVYFFVLAVLPKKRLIASLLALSVLLSPMVQWWYQYITLAPMYYGLAALISSIYLLRATSIRNRLLWSLAITYFGISFAIVEYPAFQIPILFIILGYIAGDWLNAFRNNIKGRTLAKDNYLYIVAAGLVSLVIVGVFIAQKLPIITTISQTVYPGSRHISSGGFDVAHFFSGNLAPQFQRDSRASAYVIEDIHATNQSESSNFIFIFPFLAIPGLMLLMRTRGERGPPDFRLILTLAAIALLLAWMFIPGLDMLGKFTFLDIVPTRRVLLGLGLANLLLITLWIRHYNIRLKNVLDKKNFILIYSLILLLFYVYLDIFTQHRLPGFIGTELSLLFAIPVPLFVYLLLSRRYTLALSGLVVFSFISICKIHPLYIGTAVLTNSQLASSVQSVEDNEFWVVEDNILENFAYMYGKPSLSGVMPYPNLDMWAKVFKDSDIQYKDILNRYAHVNFSFNKNSADTQSELKITSPASDQVVFSGNICDPSFSKMNIGHLLTSATYNPSNFPCLTQSDVISYPAITYYIYDVSY